MDNEKLKLSALGIQCLATFCISFLASQTGFICAWPSYTVENFQSNTTILNRPMNSVDISLLGGLPNLGGLVVTPFCGYLFNTLGRKYATIMFGLPYMLAWIIVAITKSVPMILIAMTIGGIGIAGQNVSLIFIAEIAHDSVRGGLTACSASGYFLGILISYILGGYLNYYQVVYTHLILSVVCVAALFLLEESPVYLVLVGKEEEAAKAIAFYNQVDVTSKRVTIEIRKIKIQLDPRLEKILENGKDAGLSEELLKIKLGDVVETHKESSWKIFKKSKSSKRALTAVLIVIALTVMMGAVVLQVYAETLFKEAVPLMSSNLCAIFLAVDFTLASVVCVLVIDKFGRKRLLAVTSALSGVCTLLLATQLQLHWAPHWFTVLLIYLYTFIYTVGCAVIPFVLAAEVFLPEVRGFCNSIAMGFVWVVNFITLFIFNPVVDNYGLVPVFYFFSAVCFLGNVYAILKLPETKGLSADAIQSLFLK
ncbi:hypothetical protein evm_003177 [Chilo suppressalis]|nr:hypothetical protein evm_003177 [Chilo suppressalis]